MIRLRANADRKLRQVEDDWKRKLRQVEDDWKRKLRQVEDDWKRKLRQVEDDWKRKLAKRNRRITVLQVSPLPELIGCA